MRKPALFLCLLTVLVLCGCAPSGAPDDDDPPADPVAINIIESSASVEAGRTFQFHYSVSNTSNTACTWSVNDVSGGNATVGTINAQGLYTAPATVPNPAQVTVEAVAAADTTKSDTATVTITAPPPYTVSPATATVPAGGTQPFSTTADVTWSLEGAAGNTAPLGAIGADGVFTAPLAPPLGGEVTVVATSKSNPALRATAVAVVQFSNASFHGPYAFVYRGADAADLIYIGGRLTADGAGGITDGLLYMSQGSGVLQYVPFTGAYQVVADGRASLSLSVGEDSIPLRLVLVSDDSARLIGFATGRTGTGELERQEASAFGTPLLGTFVFSYAGTDHYTSDDPKRGQPIAAAGRFISSSDTLDRIHDGIVDINRNGQWITSGDNGAAFFGSVTDHYNFGSGWIGLGGVLGVDQIGYFKLSEDEALFVGWYISGFLGERIGVIGKFVRQGAGPFSASSFSGDLANLSHGFRAVASPTPDPFVPPAPAFSAGFMTANGAGQITGGSTDTNAGGTVGQGLAVSGPYAIVSNGRGTSTITAGGLTNYVALYLRSNNTALTVGLDAWGTGISFFSPRGGGPFSAASLNGRYAFLLGGTLTTPGTDVCGQLFFNGQGALTGAVDVNVAGLLSTDVSVTGSYTMSATGRGTATVSTPTATWTMTLYAKDAETVYLLGTSYPANGTFVRQY